MSEEIKKCLACALSSNHKFKDCSSQDCMCGCLEEIYGQTPLAFEDFPYWFRMVSRKDAARFNRVHIKKGEI